MRRTTRRAAFALAAVATTASLTAPTARAECGDTVRYLADPDPKRDTNANWVTNCRVSTTSYSRSYYTVLIQQTLVSWGYDRPVVDGVKRELKVDGSFGEITRQAVIDYQDGFRLRFRDGVVGRETWGKMRGHWRFESTPDAANRLWRSIGLIPVSDILGRAQEPNRIWHVEWKGAWRPLGTRRPE